MAWYARNFTKCKVLRIIIGAVHNRVKQDWGYQTVKNKNVLKIFLSNHKTMTHETTLHWLVLRTYFDFNDNIYIWVIISQQGLQVHDLSRLFDTHDADKKSFMSIGGSVYWLHFTHAGRSANVHAPVFIKCSISYISTVMATLYHDIIQVCTEYQTVSALRV